MSDRGLHDGEVDIPPLPSLPELVESLRKKAATLEEENERLRAERAELREAWDAVADEFPGPHEGWITDRPKDLMLGAVRDLKAKRSSLKAQVGALLAELEEMGNDLRDDHAALFLAEAKIDAALALHRLAPEPMQPEGSERICGCGNVWANGYCTSPTVKALKGEPPEPTEEKPNE